MYSPSIAQLIDAFCRLPGVGPKTAERFVFYLLKRGKREVGAITQSLDQLLNNVRSCAVCFDFSESDLCSICSNNGRDTSTICVVADPQDVQALERSGAFRGRYHVLRGVLDPAREVSTQHIKIAELFKRLQSEDTPIKEVILGLNPDMQGETTSLYLVGKLKEYPIKLTRLARGLPLGSDLDYADDITLTNALKGRQNV